MAVIAEPKQTAAGVLSKDIDRENTEKWKILGFFVFGKTKIITISRKGE
jgi:hypothetical protein